MDVLFSEESNFEIAVLRKFKEPFFFFFFVTSDKKNKHSHAVQKLFPSIWCLHGPPDKKEGNVR